ncbi:MAG TPA: VWA domain-containing protein [bacterium]|jgi:VWFA-related protein
MKIYRQLKIHIPLIILSLIILAGCGGGANVNLPTAPNLDNAGVNNDQPSGEKDPEDTPPNIQPDDNPAGEEPAFYIADPDQPKGNLTFEVNWDGLHSGQVIPQQTNRIIIYISGENIYPAMGVIINKVDQPSNSVLVPVPAGRDRLVSAIARYVPDMDPNLPALITKPTYQALLEGTMLASGSTMAFDLAEDEQKEVTVTMGLPGSLDPEDEYIQLGGSQFDDEHFPTMVIYASVMDHEGKPVQNLKMTNFRVFEQTEGMVNPREAIITDVRYVGESGGLRQGSVVLCLDRSGSMSGGPNQNLTAAANQFVELMYSDDSAAIVNFTHIVRLDQDWTMDKDLLHEAISVGTSGYTALFDAVYFSIEKAAERTGRKAIVIMTDGMENSSGHTLGQIANLVTENPVPCYTIGLGSVDTHQLNNLAEATGGEAFFTPNSDELEEIYKSIGVALGSQIRITYVSGDHTDYTPDRLRKVFVYLTNYPPHTNNGDILAFETTYSY